MNNVRLTFVLHRFKGELEKVYIYRPSGLLARELSVRKLFNLPFVRYESLQIIVLEKDRLTILMSLMQDWNYILEKKLRLSVF